MSYLLGWKALKAFVRDNDPLAFFKAKMGPELFKGEEERKAFDLVNTHFQTYKVLPKIETIVGTLPGFAEVEAGEPAEYYIDLLDKRYSYDRMNKLTMDVQAILKKNQADTGPAQELITTAQHDLTNQKMRRQVLDMGSEGGSLLMTAYGQKLMGHDQLAIFGWDYMDEMTSGVGAGEVVSYVGRPAQGKTWFMVHGALVNWTVKKTNVLFVSMEMNTIQIAQRIGSIYAKVGVKGIKEAHLSTPMFKRFKESMQVMESETGKLYILDGNLTANIEELYTLAYQLDCSATYIDGAYLVRSVNPRLGRYEVVADNVVYMKRTSGQIGIATFASWQFNREAVKKDSKKGQKAGIEDIGSSDVIGQVSSIVLGLMQEDGVETLNQRRLSVLKGRNGEVGGFNVNWDFNLMDFSQAGAAPNSALEFI